VPELRHGRRGLGRLPLDSAGGEVLGRGESQFAVVRHGPVWYAVRAAPSGRHPYLLRDDFGLVAVKLFRHGHWSDLMRLKPATVGGGPDSAGPVLRSASQPGFAIGARMSISGRGSVTVRGGFGTAPSASARIAATLTNGTVVKVPDFTPGTLLRSAAVFRFQPLACGGVGMSVNTQPGDVYEYSQFFRSAPQAQGASVGDAGARLTTTPPGRVSIETGYASGLDPHLWRARVRFPPSTGRPIKASLCATAP
jgi:hypothetical protein